MGKTIGRPPKLILQICSKIETQWVAGKAPDTRLPGEIQLAKQYKVSRPTIRSALSVLENQRMVLRRPKVGYFVAQFNWFKDEALGRKEIGISFANASAAFQDPFLINLMGGIFSELTFSELNLMMSCVDWRWMSGVTADSFFNVPHIIGLFLLERHRDDIFDSLLDLKKHLVAVDFDATDRGVDSVCFDNESAGAFLGRRLKQLGHRHVAAIFENPKKAASARDEAWTDRRKGLLKEWGKNSNLLEVFMDDRGLTDDALSQIARLLRRNRSNRPTAIVVPTSGTAEPVARLIESMNLKTPQDVTVMGFGNEGDSNDMTGIRFDGNALGKKAAEHMFGNICNLHSSHKTALIKIKGRYLAGKTHARPCRSE